MKFCKVCRTPQIDNNAKFCSKCGAKLEEEQPKVESEKVETKSNTQSNSILEAMNKAKEMREANEETQHSQPSQTSQTTSSINQNSQGYVPDETFSDMFLKKDGRLNRLRYFKRGLVITSINSISQAISMSFGLFISALSYYLYYVLARRRLQDLGKGDTLAKIFSISGVVYSLIFLSKIAGKDEYMAAFEVMVVKSPISIIFGLGMLSMGLYLTFAKGTTGANQYGSDPLGNTTPYSPNNSTFNSSTSQSNGGKNNSMIWIGGILVACLLLAFVANSTSNNTTPHYKEQQQNKRNNDYNVNDVDNRNSNSNNNRNTNTNTSPPNYNYTIKGNGVEYKGINNGRCGICLIELSTQKEIYSNFSKSPRARGNFYVVCYAVGNLTNEPIFFGDIYLIDNQGRKFSYDINATSTFTTMIDFNDPYQINPGEAFMNYAIFDIPENTNIVKARYEGFMVTNAIEVPYRVVTN